MDGMTSGLSDCTAPPIGRVRAAAVAVAAVLTALSAWGQFARYHQPWRSGLAVAIGLVACAAVPVLMRRPVPAALGLAALAAVAPTATPAATIGVVHVARCRRLGIAVAVAAASLAGHAVQGLWWPVGGLSYGWWLVLMAVAHAALVGWGAVMRSRAAVIDVLRERARRAEADQAHRLAQARAAERGRIAREMHDVLAHRLSLLATYAGAVEYRPDATPEQLAAAAGVIRATAHQALAELRDVIGVLRTDEPAEGDGTGPQPVLGDLPRLVEESRAAGTPVRLDDRVAGADVPATAGRTAYRLVQEALTNARRHAGGQPVEVLLSGVPGDRLVIEVRNPMPVGAPAPGGTGNGLVGMAERVRLAGGELDHRVEAGGTFRVRAWIPWPA